ncbi:MAG: carbon-phosphorus lyase complex subunit PhnI [Moorellaceae bacterium]
MGYVPIKGGKAAIEAAEELVHYFRLRGGSAPLEIQQIQDQMRLAVDRVMSEGSLYAPFYAALALKQAEGDTIEASFILRAYRSTLPRFGYSLVADTKEMAVIRRISAAFKDIPGGQILGPTRDYSLRLLDFQLAEENPTSIQEFLRKFTAEAVTGEGEGKGEGPSFFPKVIDMLRAEGLLETSDKTEETEQTEIADGEMIDITRQPLTFPAPRAARLQAMARGETGGLMALAYSSMRGYGNIHPTLGELRVGYVPLRVHHKTRPYEVVTVGRILVTEAEVIARMDDGEEDIPRFTLGYGFCFGHNEIKAISMAVLDRAMRTGSKEAPAEDEEFVLYHIDGIEASGFTAHWKLPHYVTFQSVLDRLRRVQQVWRKGEGSQ